MSTIIRHSATISDEEPDGNSPITVAQEQFEAREIITIRQGSDLLYLSCEHARAVGQALLDLAKEPTA